MRDRLIEASALVLLVLLALSGCVNLKAVEKFAKGTEAVATASARFYQGQLETDRQLAVATLDLKTDDFQSAVGGKNLISETRTHGAAVQALAAYAKSLGEIAKFDDDASIEKESKKLAASLNSIADTLDKSIPGESALAAAIAGVGEFYVDTKKRAVIYATVEKAHPFVEKIINTLTEDIKRESNRIAIGRVSAAANRETLYDGLSEGYAGSSKAEKVYRTIAAGKLVDQELAEMATKYSEEEFLKKFEKTAKACVAAHEAIRVKNLDERAAAIVDFVERAQGLTMALASLGS